MTLPPHFHEVDTKGSSCPLGIQLFTAQSIPRECKSDILVHIPPPSGCKRCHSAIALGLLPWFLLSRWYLALESSTRPTTSFPSRWPCYSSFRALLRCSTALIFPTAIKHVPTLYRSVLGHTQGDLLSLSHNAGPRPSSSHNRAVEISDLHKERPSM